ncbi:DNA-directed RNA polymerase III subunit RPC4-like [Telopea speciosissima]|uniref:DNA-directed RNA polymerase III subunit RPC4-like n=1 Tax=Telopea speciosissima TaxID=54955 RepID=UPI001CC449D1|nr:DNA-directed RNA polymerase III subunit RPC4-like [Telopea speciosissima]XP_043712419.1 DNA-directed RNA polymerase III subunit RPC4-like [Telopea speciosissima]
MEPDPTSNPSAAPRKVKFKPKVPPRRESKPVLIKNEVIENEDAKTRELLQRINESSGRGRPKIEKKSAPVQVAFGQGQASNFMRSYGPPRGAGASRSQDGANMSSHMLEKEYIEPWNYCSYYPLTLPLRRPYSGNPVFLDEEEFGEASTNITNNEYSTNSAIELGLMEEQEEQKMIFFQLPTSLPLVKRSAVAESNQITGSAGPSSNVGSSDKGCSLEQLSAGLMGKMLVYKSGAVKLKLGDTLYDVSPGSDCAFAQDVVAVNTEEKHCCILGLPDKRAIVTPNVNSLLSRIADLD